MEERFERRVQERMEIGLQEMAKGLEEKMRLE